MRSYKREKQLVSMRTLDIQLPSTTHRQQILLTIDFDGDNAWPLGRGNKIPSDSRFVGDRSRGKKIGDKERGFAGSRNGHPYPTFGFGQTRAGTERSYYSNYMMMKGSYRYFLGLYVIS